MNYQAELIKILNKIHDHQLPKGTKVIIDNGEEHCFIFEPSFVPDWQENEHHWDELGDWLVFDTTTLQQKVTVIEPSGK